MAFPVFLDTCTLFGQSLCDLLLSLAERGCFAPFWSEAVLDAMERAVTSRGVRPELVHRRRVLMERTFPEALVVGHEHLAETMTNHPDDRHVLAACVVSPANTLVTFNLMDFPPSSLAPYEIEAIHPDDFVLDLLDLHPIWSAQAIESMLRKNRRPPHDRAALAGVLTRAGVPRAATVIARLV